MDPWVLSAFLGAFIAALCWMAALSKLDLSYAFPFLSLSFFFVTILSAVIFNETITTAKMAGLACIMVGILLSAQG